MLEPIECMREAWRQRLAELPRQHLGFRFFHSRQLLLGVEKCSGACVYDATNGSLRLTHDTKASRTSSKALARVYSPAACRFTSCLE